MIYYDLAIWCDWCCFEVGFGLCVVLFEIWNDWIGCIDCIYYYYYYYYFDLYWLICIDCIDKLVELVMFDVLVVFGVFVCVELILIGCDLSIFALLFLLCLRLLWLIVVVSAVIGLKVLARFGWKSANKQEQWFTKW